MSMLVFTGVYVIGNPVDVLISPDVTQEMRQQVIQQYGLDLPLWEQYFQFLQRLLTGDLGRSFVFNMPVVTLIAQRLPATLELTLIAVLFASLVGIPLGIAAARNRALDEAQGNDLLLFLDDDGRPGEGWLRRMVDAWRASGAAGVAGWVDTHYLGEVDPWIMAGGFFTRRQWTDGQDLPAAACGNLLLDLHQVGDRRFSLGLGLSGGEDTLLTKSLIADGGRIVFCRDGIVIDQVATDRINRRWVLLRAFSHGNTGGILDMHLTDSRMARPKLAANGLARLGGGAARALVGVGRRNPVDQARGSRAAMRGLGMLVAAAGVSYQEYAREGGFKDRFVAIPDVVAPGTFTTRRTSVPTAEEHA